MAASSNLKKTSTPTCGSDRKPVCGEGMGTPDNNNKKQQLKACRGVLYFSSRLRSRGRDPHCIGTLKTFPRVPAQWPELYNIASREGNLSHFKRICIGDSVFPSTEDFQVKEQEKPVSVPVCLGYELLLGKHSSHKVSKNNHRVQQREDLYFLRSRAYSTRQANYIGRFTRNAELVASGIAKNLVRVKSYIQENIHNLLNPDRRRPK